MGISEKGTVLKKVQRFPVDRILIRSTNWIGDALMTTPAIQAIRFNFPLARISILARPWVAPIYEHNPDIDHILIDETKVRHKGPVGLWHQSRQLRREKFDLAVLLPNSFESAFLSFLARVPVRAGYDTDGRKIFLTHAVRLKAAYKRYHQIDYYLKMVEKLGLRTFGRELRLIVSDVEKKRAQKRFRDSGISSSKLLIGINPGAAFGTAKRWFPDRYVALARQLISTYDAYIAVFGSSGEKKLGERIAAQIGEHCVNLCGETTLREAIAAINICDLFVTNDSGLMHVAAALNVPQIAVFGSTDSVTTSPGSSRSRIVQVPIACNPCLKPECPEGHHLCMKNITVDMVFEAVQQMLPPRISGRMD